MKIFKFTDFINEDYVSMRKLALKSIINFGNYKDLTVQNIIDQNKEKELLHIYYHLGNIDFNDEVKAALCINERRSIPKPGKDDTAYRFFLKEILNDIITKKKEKGEYNANLIFRDSSMAKKDAKLRAKKENEPRAVISSYGSGKK
jgi:hypothetical protein